MQTSDAGSPTAGGRLLLRLRAVTARMRVIERLRRVMLGLALLGAALLGWAVVDAVVVMPMFGRWLGLIGMAGVGAGALVWSVLLRRDDQRDERIAGAMIDQNDASGRMKVVVGLDLASGTEADDPLALMLRRRAIEQGCEVAEAASPRAVLPTRLLGRPVSRLWLVLVVFLVLTLLFPGLVPSGLHRLIQPAAPLPAYNLTRLNVSWSPADPVYGTDVSLTVNTKGLKPAGVDLLLLDHKGAAADPFALTRRADDRYVGVLRNVREPIRFVLVVNGRRSAVYTITPKAEEEPDAPPSEEQPAEADIPDGQTVRGHESQPSPESEALTDNLTGLLQQLASLIEQIEQARAGDAQELAALRDAINALLASAEQGAAQAEALAEAGVPYDLAQALDDLAQTLSAMGLGGVPTPPGGASPGEPADPQAGQSWLDQVADAARQDERALAEGLGALESATESGTSNLGGDPSDPSPRDPSAVGRFEGDLNRIDSGNLPQATLRRVPARYRDHIAAYFRQLAQDPASPSPTEDRP